jgi:hypothetical protein
MLSQKISLLLVISAFTLVGTSGCASKPVEKQIDQQADNERANNRDELKIEARKRIEASTSITKVQRKALLVLLSETEASIAKDAKTSLKLRSLLIAEIIKPNYKDEKIQIIKTKIMRAENKRVATILNATVEANRILGRSDQPRNDKLQWFMLDDALSKRYTEE